MADVAEKYKSDSGAWSDGTQVKPGSALVFGAATGQWTLARAPKWYNTNNSADDGSDHLRPRPWSPGGGGGGNLRWKPHSHVDRKLAVLVSGGRGGTLTVNGVQGTYIGQTNGNRATYRFPKPGSAYGTNIKVVYSNGGTWTIPNGASDLKNFKSDSAKSTGIKPKWEGLGFGWGETCYSGVTFPLVEPGLEHAARLGFKRIVVFPYFLFTGILVKRIYAHTDLVAQRHPEIEFIKAPYLNDHPLVLDTFAERVDEILEGRNQMNCQLCKYREQVLGFETEVGLPQESHHHHVEGIGTGSSHHHHHEHEGHTHDHDHDHRHHPYPHADHPLGPKTLEEHS